MLIKKKSNWSFMIAEYKYKDNLKKKINSFSVISQK